MSNRHSAQKKVFRILTPIVEQRLTLRPTDSNATESPVRNPTILLSAVADQEQVDCMQWLIETSPRKQPWTINRTVHEIMAVWFSSMPQLIMVNYRAALRFVLILSNP